jgi:hypothetical protein
LLPGRFSRNCRARNALQVASETRELQGRGRAEESLDIELLAEAEFKHEVAAVAEVAGRFVDEASDRVESVLAGIQSQRRLLTNLRLQPVAIH